jgi:hypothetical protein
MLARREHRHGIVEPPSGKAQPLERLGALVSAHRGLE